MQLTTPRLLLRTARPEDLEAMHAVLADPHATRWWSDPPHRTKDQTAAWLEKMMANGPDHPDFVVEFEGRVIGKAGFYEMPAVGYILHPEVWGLGLASEAVRTVVDHVFATREVEILTADVDPDNARSIRLLERLGFIRIGFAERTWNIAGAWKDSLYFALSRTDRAVRASTQPPA